MIDALNDDQRPTIHRVIPLRQWLINKCQSDENDATAISPLKGNPNFGRKWKMSKGKNVETTLDKRRM